MDNVCSNVLLDHLALIKFVSNVALDVSLVMMKTLVIIVVRVIYYNQIMNVYQDA